MNKMTRKIIPILGVAGMALTALMGNAQSVIQYHTGDLIADFSEAGSPDLEVDLGSLSTLSNAAAAAGGTYEIGSYNITSQLLNNFGGSAAGVAFTVFGAAGVINSDDYLTLRRASPGTPNPAPNDWTPSKGNSILSQIGGITSGLTTYSANNPADPVANTPSAVLLPSSASESSQWVESYTYHRTGLTGYTGQNIGNTLAGSSAVSDLYDYAELGVGTQATFEGSFTFNSDGSLDFTAAAVPEPKVWGLLAGGLLVLWQRHRIKSKTT